MHLDSVVKLQRAAKKFNARLQIKLIVKRNRELERIAKYFTSTEYAETTNAWLIKLLAENKTLETLRA